MQHLYISYPPSDYDLAHRLVDDLQAAGYAVFVDAVSETGSITWASETRRAIRTCGAMIMLLTDSRRRVGIRHEGILANRRHKPVFVVAGAPQNLPRYLLRGTVIPYTGDYDSIRDQLLATLPSAAYLLTSDALPVHRRPRPPQTRSRRRILTCAGLILLLAGICLVLAFLFGMIPS